MSHRLWTIAALSVASLGLVPRVCTAQLAAPAANSELPCVPTSDAADVPDSSEASETEPPPAPISRIPPGAASATNIQLWLAAGDLRLIAWGAYFAAQSCDTSAIPELTALANHWQPPSPSAGYTETRDCLRTMSAILDALLQMNSHLPVETLRALAPSFDNEVAVFLSRMPAEDTSKLRMEFFEDEHLTSSRTASAALLALHPAPGFAQELMHEIEVTAVVTVVSPWLSGGIAVGSSSCGVGCGLVVDPNWPPVALHQVSTEKTKNAVAIVDGIVPIYYSRLMKMNASHSGCGARGVWLSNEMRHQLAAELSGLSSDTLAWELRPKTTITFYLGGAVRRGTSELRLWRTGQTASNRAIARR